MRFYHIRTIVYIILFLVTTPKAFGQQLTPITINNGGGTGMGSEWSMGESVSIAYFTTPGFFLSTGVLQPLSSVVTGINEFGPAVFGNDIIVGPNPTISKIHLKASFTQMGTLSIQILDAKSTLLKLIEAGTIFSTYEKSLDLETYPSGILYLRVLYKPNNGILKSGIYKIIKL